MARSKMKGKSEFKTKTEKLAGFHNHGDIEAIFKIMHLPESEDGKTIKHFICLVCGEDITPGLKESALIPRRDPLAR